jgi:ketosteroid isomerase-like protein
MAGNVDVVRAGFDAWNRENLEGWLAILDPDAEFHTSGVFPDFERIYRGHAELAEFWRAMHEPWETLQLEVEHIEEHADWVVYEFRFHGHGADSGAEADLRFANAARFRDGREVEIVARRTLDAARELAMARSLQGGEAPGD